MTRPSRNMDQQLLKAGKEIIMEQGLTGLQLRRVAERAKVNIAMISYHFGNKEEFTRQVLLQVYEGFFEKFKLEIDKGEDPEERLRKAWRIIAQIVRNNRRLFIAVLRDVLNGNQEILQFFEKNMLRHVKDLVGLIQACKRANVIGKVPLPWIFAFLGLNMVGPNMALGIMEQLKFSKPLELLKKTLVPVLLSDPLIDKRLDLVFKALAPENKSELKKRGGK